MSNILGPTYDEMWEQRVEARAAASAAQAELRTCRELLRDLLQERFGTVPEDVQQRIEACADLARLKAALRQVLHV